MPLLKLKALRHLGLSHAALLALLVSACGGSKNSGADGGVDASTQSLPTGCQPLLGGADCLLPYPSDFFRVADSTMPSGARIELAESAKLRDKRDRSADLGEWRPIDGFSIMPTIVAVLPSAVSAKGLPAILDTPTDSSLKASASLLIEADTGRLVPHFADLDPTPDDAEHQAILIHPIEGLKVKTRYVVVLRNLEQPDGTPAVTPPGFALLRDGKTDGHEALAALADHFENDIFSVTGKAGVDRASIQLAWDFTTRSEESATSDMLRVRELTLAWLKTNTPTVTITSVVERHDEAGDGGMEDNPDGGADAPQPGADAFRTIRGTLTGPLFLDDPKPGSALHRGGDGQVAQNGTTTFEFIAEVPLSVRDAFGPGRVLQFGHGFFGSREELDSDATRGIADHLGAVSFAIDWWGMSSDDLATVINNLAGDPVHGLAFTDRVHQGMANQIVLAAAIRGPLLAESAFHRPASGPGTSTNDQDQSNAGAPLYDAGSLNFLGISMGHILGSVYAALNPALDRIALQVGGASFTLMMSRARPFSAFLSLLQSALPDELSIAKWEATSAGWFDRIDPGTYAHYVLTDVLPDADGHTPTRKVLQTAGLGDAQVPNAASFLHARMLGVKALKANPVAVYGLDAVDAPYDGSALALYDFGIDVHKQYDKAQAGDENAVHTGLRLQSSVQAQLSDFFKPDGQITLHCDGVCDPN